MHDLLWYHMHLIHPFRVIFHKWISSVFISYQHWTISYAFYTLPKMDESLVINMPDSPSYANHVDPPDNFSISDYIIFLDSSTRSSSQGKIRSALPLPKSSLSNHFYFNRIVRIWNSLPLIDLDSPFSSIKKQIYSIYWDYFITSYSLDNSCSWYCVCLFVFLSFNLITYYMFLILLLGIISWFCPSVNFIFTLLWFVFYPVFDTVKLLLLLLLL